VNDLGDVHEWPIDRVEIGDIPIEVALGGADLLVARETK